MPKAKILFLDIETAPILASVWSIWNVNIGLNQIERDWSILSFAAKWLDEKKIIYHDVSKEKNFNDDKKLLGHLHKLLDKANLVVAQNGRRFDIPKINARMIVQGFKPPSPYKVVDTKDIAKKHFSFTSNRLEHLSKLLCVQKKDTHKKFPGFELWQECLKGNPKAWKEMKFYNIQDTLTLEELYLKLRGWTSSHPNVSTFDDEEVPQCPKCGGTHVNRKGMAVTTVGKYQEYQCQDCGSWSRGSILKNTKEKRKSLLRVINNG